MPRQQTVYAHPSCCRRACLPCVTLAHRVQMTKPQAELLLQAEGSWIQIRKNLALNGSQASLLSDNSPQDVSRVLHHNPSIEPLFIA